MRLSEKSDPDLTRIRCRINVALCTQCIRRCVCVCSALITCMHSMTDLSLEKLSRKKSRDGNFDNLGVLSELRMFLSYVCIGQP